MSASIASIIPIEYSILLNWQVYCTAMYILYVHCVQKKTPTYVFDYNFSISWSIFILLIPVEREMNTLKFTYVQS